MFETVSVSSRFWASRIVSGLSKSSSFCRFRPISVSSASSNLRSFSQSTAPRSFVPTIFASNAFSNFSSSFHPTVNEFLPPSILTGRRAMSKRLTEAEDSLDKESDLKKQKELKMAVINYLKIATDDPSSFNEECCRLIDICKDLLEQGVDPGSLLDRAKSAKNKPMIYLLTSYGAVSKEGGGKITPLVVYHSARRKLLHFPGERMEKFEEMWKNTF